MPDNNLAASSLASQDLLVANIFPYDQFDLEEISSALFKVFRQDAKIHLEPNRGACRSSTSALVDVEILTGLKICQDCFNFQKVKTPSYELNLVDYVHDLNFPYMPGAKELASFYFVANSFAAGRFSVGFILTSPQIFSIGQYSEKLAKSWAPGTYEKLTSFYQQQVFRLAKTIPVLEVKRFTLAQNALAKLNAPDPTRAFSVKALRKFLVSLIKTYSYARMQTSLLVVFDELYARTFNSFNSQELELAASLRESLANCQVEEILVLTSHYRDYEFRQNCSFFKVAGTKSLYRLEKTYAMRLSAPRSGPSWKAHDDFPGLALPATDENEKLMLLAEGIYDASKGEIDSPEQAYSVALAVQS